MSKRRHSFARGWDTPSEGTTTASSSSDDEARVRDTIPRKRVHLDNGQERRFAHMSIYPSTASAPIHPTAVEEATTPPVSPYASTQPGRGDLPQAEEIYGSAPEADAGLVGVVEEPPEGASARADAGAYGDPDGDGDADGEAMDQSTSRGGWYDLDKNRIWVQSLSDSSDSENGQFDTAGQQDRMERRFTVLPNVLARLDRKYRERMARRRAGHNDDDDDSCGGGGQTDRKALIPYTPQHWPIPPGASGASGCASAAPVPVPDLEDSVIDDTPTASSKVPAEGVQQFDPQGTQRTQRARGTGWMPNPQFNMPIYGMAAPAYPVPANSQPTLPLNSLPPDDTAMELD